ncbi:hypothetical protein TRIUR3_00794 [Triticum urartu]|uniref:Uncharacterized protein n=1 Tax=Triticum urartu TaxID=4572 RepID=M8AX48_TRIUA|nr:hypothetical protein TRIUR3_00794 [Triticum urartu]
MATAHKFAVMAAALCALLVLASAGQREDCYSTCRLEGDGCDAECAARPWRHCPEQCTAQRQSCEGWCAEQRFPDAQAAR